MISLQPLLSRRLPGKRRSPGPVGLHLDQGSLSLAQLSTSPGNRATLQAWASATYPGTCADLLSSPAAFARLVKRELRAGRFSGRTVVAALPTDQVRIMSVAYPAASAGDDAAGIAKIMAERLPGPFSDYVIDYLPVRQSARDDDRLALVAVSRRQQVMEYLSLLDSAGLHVAHLEVESTAICRLLARQADDNTFENIVFLDIGDDTTRITTLSGRRLLASQALDYGSQMIVQTLTEALSLGTGAAEDLLQALDGAPGNDPEVARSPLFDANDAAMLAEVVQPALLRLQADVQRAFLYADSESQAHPAKRVILTGRIARWPGLVRRLGTLLKVPVQLLGSGHLPLPVDAANNAVKDQDAAAIAVATGLALRGEQVGS